MSIITGSAIGAGIGALKGGFDYYNDDDKSLESLVGKVGVNSAVGAAVGGTAGAGIRYFRPKPQLEVAPKTTIPQKPAIEKGGALVPLNNTWLNQERNKAVYELRNPQTRGVVGNISDKNTTAKNKNWDGLSPNGSEILRVAGKDKNGNGSYNAKIMNADGTYSLVRIGRSEKIAKTLKYNRNMQNIINFAPNPFTAFLEGAKDLVKKGMQSAKNIGLDNNTKLGAAIGGGVGAIGGTADYLGSDDKSVGSLVTKVAGNTAVGAGLGATAGYAYNPILSKLRQKKTVAGTDVKPTPAPTTAAVGEEPVISNNSLGYLRLADFGGKRYFRSL